jgi:hypothetical protein
MRSKKRTNMSRIHPFQNEAESISFGGFTIENRVDRVTIYGNLDVTRDKPGLTNARQLKEIIDLIVQALEGDTDLPDKIAPPKATKTVKNPFAKSARS